MNVEVFYLNSTLNFGILPVLVFQLEVCYKLDILLTGITAQPKGTTARWYSNKTSLDTLASNNGYGWNNNLMILAPPSNSDRNSHKNYAIWHLKYHFQQKHFKFIFR